jgi:hypothetical protein
MSSNKYCIIAYILFFTFIPTGIVVLIRDNIIDNSILKLYLAFTAVVLILLSGLLVASWINKHDANINLISAKLINHFTLDYRLEKHNNLRFAIRFKHNVAWLNFTITTLYNDIPVDVFESGNLFRIKTAEKVKDELLNWDLEKHEAVCYNKYLEKVIDKL